MFDEGRDLSPSGGCDVEPDELAISLTLLEPSDVKHASHVKADSPDAVTIA
jgi:hypothetical protein